MFLKHILFWEEKIIRDAVLDKRLNQRHARRFRLIGAALGGKIEWLIRFMEGKRLEVME